MMDYSEALNFIHRNHNFSAKPGLDRMRELCALLGDPQEDLKIIHVAGTNGKGSTVTMIACALEDAGYKVGKYTSPYVYEFRERIEINGEMISEDELVQATEVVKAACEKLSEAPTEFEIVTAIAFVYFKAQKCDYVVLEVGLGGRLDATNVITKPLMSVICSISLDHTQVLGDTEAKIAAEKAGIIKSGCPCVLYPSNSEEVIAVVARACRRADSRLVTVDASKLKIKSTTTTSCAFEYKKTRYTPALMGLHQVYNALTAITALELLNIETEYMVSGIGRAKLHGRYEVISDKPRVIIDVGHNSGGIECLLRAIKNDRKIKSLTFIYGTLKDKAYQYSIRELASRADKMICVAPDSPRALSAYDTKNIADMFCTECYHYEDVSAAVKEALFDPNSTVIVCGSFYLIDKVVKEIKKQLKTT